MKREGDKLSNIHNEKSEYSRVCGSLITQYITSKYDLEQVILISEPQFPHPIIWEEKSCQKGQRKDQKAFKKSSSSSYNAFVKWGPRCESA